MNGRLFEIVYYLLDKKTTTAKELANYFEVSVRTIYRDIDKLLVAGVPVESMQGKNGGISIDKNYVLDKTLLSTQEQDHILMALQGMKSLHVQDNELSKRMQTLFQKESHDWLEIDFSYWHQDEEMKDKFNMIKQSIFNKYIITFEYMDMKGQKSHKDVFPLKMIFKAQAWYLQGYDINKKSYRTYKLNRIHELILTTISFDKTIGDMPVNQTYHENSKLIDITLSFDKSLGSFVYDEFSYQSIQETESAYLVKTQMPHHSWLISHILSFGHGVEVIEPQFLREEIIQEIYKLNHKYFIS